VLNRIVGAVGVLWGALMLLSAFVQIGAYESGSYAAIAATLLFALSLVGFGGYCLLRGSKA
jgi:hypothetical protein